MIFPLPVAAHRFANKGVTLPGSRERTGGAFVAKKRIMDTAPSFDQPRVNDFLEKKLILIMCACGRKILDHCFDISKQTAFAAPHAAHYGHAMVWVVAHYVPCKATALPFINSGFLARGQPGISITHDDALNILVSQSPKSPEHATVVVNAAHPNYLCTSLLQALECLKKQGTDARLVVFGENPAGNDLNFPSTSVGFVHDPARLATLYAAADVFVIPSMQDNLPTTVLESSACGTPCVAFDIGGIPDMIIHNENGYLARKFDVVDLAHGIKLILQSPELAQRWGSNAREHIFSNYESSMIARQHIELYQRVIRRG